MTLREKLANWISGGAITRRDAIIDSMDRCVGRMEDEHAYALGDLICALQAIAAQEKPTSNSTVKRMARIAREALK